MLKRMVTSVSGLYRPRMWATLAIAVVMIIIQILPLTAVQASPPDSGKRIFHNPIVSGGPISGSILKASITPNAISPPFSPAQIRKAYGIDQIPGNGAGKTIAIVDAYGDANIESELQAFDAYYGLPGPPTFTIYPSPSTSYNQEWALETALDVEWAHAMAPGANILLVVAPSDYESDLLNAVEYATSQGADIVSMSWGGSEFSGETALDSYFNHAGVTYLAASGDGGAEVLWPAASQYVVAVGGTTLTIRSDGTYGSESAWSGSGGGQSAYVPKPSFQSGLSGSYRQVPDVAFDADPGSGVRVYYSGGWWAVGGTSLSTPCWAGLYALANRSEAPWLYTQAATSIYSRNYHDITTGSNGIPAVTGYDMVTGLGSPVFNNLAYGPATKLTFSTQPADAISGVAFPIQPVVTIQDSNNSTVTSYNASVSIAIANNPSAGTLSGTLTINAVNGVATFNGLSIDEIGAGYSLIASSEGLTTITSNPFNLSLGPPAKLIFTAQPEGSSYGTPLSTQPAVTILYANGTVVTNSSASVSIDITSGTGAAGAVLSGVNNVSAIGGIATFNGLSIDKAGQGYTLTAASIGLNPVVSNSFNIAGNSAKLTFTTHPSSGTAGVAFPTQPVVTIQDNAGNVVTNSSASISLSIAGGSGTPGAALLGVNNVSAVGGIVTFSGLIIDREGTGYVLNASAVGLETASSNAFNIASPPAPPAFVPTSGGGAGGGGSTGTTLDYLTRYIGDRGVLSSDTSVRTYDAKAIIFIPKGTEFKVNPDQIGAYITTRAIRTEVPPPPKGGEIIGLAYEFGPEGAAFDPAITLKMIYDPALVPSGINEGDLKIGYWDGSQWQVLDSTVDPPNRTITAQISHFNVYAVISVPPATFTLLSINISPDRLNPGDPVTIQAVVSNIGGSPGIYTAVLKVNGTQEGQQKR